MDASPESAEIRKLCEDHRNAIHELLSEKPKRYGWKHTKLDAQQTEYIIDRERVIQAVKAIQCIGWQSINAHDRELALKIREMVLHSLATMAQSMTLNEERIL